ncbi:hypothetical protein [Salegentibacter chungangensis]|uniref:Transcriptional regulator n=1 Tax=Salegentibacter chungangensis TaxID=1335724 RepID=A0ABW3NQJ9_9FLAO
MKKIDYQKPGNIEKRILQILSDRDHFDFMGLRASFPIGVTSVEKRCNDLIRLKLIAKEKIDNEYKYSLTDKGAQVLTLGLEKWIRTETFTEIKNGPYVVTKSTPNIERYTIRSLESEGKIYFDGKHYKIVPGKNLGDQNPSIEVPNENINGIIDKVVNDIYTMDISLQHMELEKTHKHEIRHVMNYLEENKIVEVHSDPVKLTALGYHIYQIGHDKWKREKEREELIGEKIKNNNQNKNSNQKTNKTWNTKISDWYSKNEKVLNFVVALVTIIGFILGLFQFI